MAPERFLIIYDLLLGSLIFVSLFSALEEMSVLLMAEQLVFLVHLSLRVF